MISTIWHIGWGAEDMKAAYQKELDLGAKFQTPLTDISDLANSPGFYYAYVDGPDHALIELIRPGIITSDICTYSVQILWRQANGTSTISAQPPTASRRILAKPASIKDFRLLRLCR